MRMLLPLAALVALALAGCSNAATSPTGPDVSQPSFSCAGQSNNCGGGNHSNNPNNPPHTTP